MVHAGCCCPAAAAGWALPGEAQLQFSPSFPQSSTPRAVVEFCGGPGTWVTRTYTAARNSGAFCNGNPIQASGWLEGAAASQRAGQAADRPSCRCRRSPAALALGFAAQRTSTAGCMSFPTAHLPASRCLPTHPTLPACQVSKVHEVANSLLVTGFGYEHDECWAQNMQVSCWSSCRC